MKIVPIPEGLACHGAIDSHCHVDRGNFGQEVEAVIERAFAHGLDKLVLVASGETPEEIFEVRHRAESDSRLVFAAGVHPHTASLVDDLWPALTEVLESKSCVALGEVGLDFHYNFSTPAEQERAFRRQIEEALQRRLPLMLHIRNAYPQCLAILREYAPAHEGVVHCFTGISDEALAFVELGFYVSFSGMLTFRQSLEIREAAKVLPLERILVETDSPYLAPEPYRGSRNEPAMVSLTIAELARLREITPMEVACTTRKNTMAVFRIAGAGDVPA